MSRSKWLQKCSCIVVACLAAVLLSVTSAQALVIVVNDSGDTTADDGLCTLREAVEAFNTQTASGATAGECGEGATFNAINDTVDLTGLSGTITLTGGVITVSGGNELTPSISIIGPGADTLTIDGNSTTARVFDADDACTGCDFDVLIYGLTVTNSGGILLSDTDTDLTLDSMVITGNTTASGVDGGGVDNTDGDLTIINSTISDNTASDTGGDGGGVAFDSSGTATIINSTISGNTAGSDGGGIDTAGGDLIITNSTISGNTADDEGGGINHDGGGSATISDSTISGNTTTTDEGGGVRIDDTDTLAFITNSTITGNTSGTEGGGISVDAANGSVVTLLNVTIISNTATTDGGGIENGYIDTRDNTIHVANSIIAGNTAVNGPDCYASPADAPDSPVITAGNNFIGDDTDCDNGDFADGVLNDQVGTTGSPINPMLAALADNSTATHAPLNNSPVIDGVDNSIVMPPALDQRGVARPQGVTDTSDIGAVQAACGDAVRQGAEECDDGKNNSDTTPDACRTDCTIAICGDGVVDPAEGEECDDGNNAAGDGCDSTCTLEVAPGCGNGVVEAGEQCDDGNTTSGDGCSSTCQTEVTTAVCGNGILEGNEECDDGNTTAGDGCSDTCTQEDGEGGGCSITAMANTSAASGLMLLGTAIALLGIRRRRS